MITAIKPYGLQSVHSGMLSAKNVKPHNEVETQQPETTKPVPVEAQRAYAFAGKNISFTGINVGKIAQAPEKLITRYFLPADGKYFLPANPITGAKTFTEVVEQYSPEMSKVLKSFKSRMDKDGQFLKWVRLPQMQLEKNANGVSHLDEVYSQAAELLARTNLDGTKRPLTVLGIGGSKHTAEFLANMAGVGNTGKLHFFADIDPFSFNMFLKQTGKRADEMNYLVVSKSGTTFETKHGMALFEKAVQDAYKARGWSEKQAVEAAQKHFAIVTDAHAKTGNLREAVGHVNGEGNNYIKELYVHDDVGGRYSMFDDEGLFTLAYAGVPKSFTKSILHGAMSSTDKNLLKELDSNPAARNAIFDNFSRDHGYGYTQQIYFGRPFEGGGENWSKQLYLESLKDFGYSVGKAPEREHYATEGDFFPKNRHMYNTIMTTIDPKLSKNYENYLKALADTYNETTPLRFEVLKVKDGVVDPLAIGQYVQNRHFETVFDGMLRRQLEFENGLSRKANGGFKKGLPEVTQDSVETYKNKFKLGEYKLTPGE